MYTHTSTRNTRATSSANPAPSHTLSLSPPIMLIPCPKHPQQACNPQTPPRSRIGPAKTPCCPGARCSGSRRCGSNCRPAELSWSPAEREHDSTKQIAATRTRHGNERNIMVPDLLHLSLHESLRAVSRYRTTPCVPYAALAQRLVSAGGFKRGFLGRHPCPIRWRIWMFDFQFLGLSLKISEFVRNLKLL